MHMDIFNDDAFSAVSMTLALEDYEFKPNLIGSMNLFGEVPISTESVSVERRAGNVLSIIQTSERGAPLAEGKTDRASLRKYDTSRIAKGHTLKASEIQNMRAFGTESDLETMIGYVGRYEQRLIGDVEMTWENMQLGALQGVVLDADGTEIVNWFTEWGIPVPAEIDFALDTATTDVESVCRGVIRAMMHAAKGAWTMGTRVVGLCGDSFFDKLTRHKLVREVYLNTSQAQALNRAFGVATQSVIASGSYATFDFGGIMFINYRGTDDFSDAAAPGTKQGLGIRSTKCKFFPMGAPDVFQKAFAPGEAFDMVNTLGRPLYAMMIRDKDRNFWVRPEVYSYPLYICTRPEMLLTAKEKAAG
ncbi:major capsid protein [Mesorhizobium sp. NZP2234]|uniref:major capsid protein n=1 Tax=Mesorhizobium sp. NZP2234 TaxID=2483402 RepID=UPI0015524B44|nr:major capsid protein [Mesorhizobium sp. NZP2234]QKC89996.1 major capsid protein [Mesorhizobium sp. NZP2234]